MLTKVKCFFFHLASRSLELSTYSIGIELYFFRISAPEGRTIELGFSSTLSNCDRQSLHIVDVANENDFKLCESKTEPIVSTGNLVYSLFTSNAETGSFVMDFRLRPAQQNEEESKSISGTGQY